MNSNFRRGGEKTRLGRDQPQKTGWVGMAVGVVTRGYGATELELLWSNWSSVTVWCDGSDRDWVVAQPDQTWPLSSALSDLRVKSSALPNAG